MQLINILYTVKNLNITNSIINADVAFMADSDIFKAHFPGEPVTPGVCIIQIAVELVCAAMNKSLTLKGVRNAKFLSVINPSTCPTVHYEISAREADNCFKLTATVTAPDGAVCSKLSLNCCEPA